MKCKPLDYYLKLKYPVSFIETDDGYEMWCPDFGRYAIVIFEKSLEKAIKELDEARKSFIEYLYEKGKDIPEPHLEDEQ